MQVLHTIHGLRKSRVVIFYGIVIVPFAWFEISNELLAKMLPKKIILIKKSEIEGIVRSVEHSNSNVPDKNVRSKEKYYRQSRYNPCSFLRRI